MKKQNLEHTRLLVLSLLAGGDLYGCRMITAPGYDAAGTLLAETTVDGIWGYTAK